MKERFESWYFDNMLEPTIDKTYPLNQYAEEAWLSYQACASSIVEMIDARIKEIKEDWELDSDQHVLEELTSLKQQTMGEK